MVPEGELSKEGMRMKETAGRLALLWAREVWLGASVVLKSAGITGKVTKVFSWGVEVETSLRDSTGKENWSWEMILKRNPRSIKRYPRPFRFPREVPTKQCHCKGGPMTIVRGAQNAVQCGNKKCRFRIGSESFPRRYRAAAKLLYEAAVARQSKAQAAQGVGRTKPKAARAVPAEGKATPGRVGVGPGGAAAAKPSTPKAAKPEGRKVRAAKAARPKARPRRKVQVSPAEVTKPVPETQLPEVSEPVPEDQGAVVTEVVEEIIAEANTTDVESEPSAQEESPTEEPAPEEDAQQEEAEAQPVADETEE